MQCSTSFSFTFRPATLSVLVGLLLLVAGCGDAIVGASCAEGFGQQGGRCVRLLDDGGFPPGDGGLDASADASLDGGDGSVDPDGGFDASIDGDVPDGCNPLPGGGCSADGGTDSAVDSSVDASTDASADAGMDASLDASMDASTDATMDADMDADMDAAMDAGPDSDICGLGELLCNGVCINPLTNRANCGDCGIVCDSSPANFQYCSLGMCTNACAAGLTLCGGECVDTTSDANHCGGCGGDCPSGICEMSMCQGAKPGHIVLIGYDYLNYTSQRPDMGRLLSNAVHISMDAPDVLVYEGSAAPGSIGKADQAISDFHTGWNRMVAATAAEVPLKLADHDVFLVYAQRMSSTDGELDQLGADWAAALAQFIRRGRIVVILDGAGGNTHRILNATGFFDVTASLPESGALDVVAAGDQVAASLNLMFSSFNNTVSFTTTESTEVVRATDTGMPVVLHKVFIPPE